MESNELERKYELVVIVDAKLTNEEKEAILKAALDVVKKEGGKVINSQVWMEKHNFTFKIKRCTEGTYYLVNVVSASSAVTKIRAILNLNEKILRFLFIRVDQKIAESAKTK